jgi:peptidoglycan DL-endopeptidase LytE
MNKLILIALASACFLLSTSVLAFSKVKSGDTVRGLAKKHRVSVERLHGAHGVKTQNMKTVFKKGHRSSMIARNTLTAATISEVVNNDGEFIEYRAKRGDTVEKVAAKFGIERDDILESNNNLGRRLSPGRVLLIPRKEDPETGDDFVDLSTRTLKSWKTDEERYMLVKVAKSFMGAPYRYGGESVRGLDCSAFVKKVYDIFDVQLPRIARDQYKTGPRISREELSVGDLVFFKTKRYAKYPTHVGIYIGEGNFIHSSSGHARIGVTIDSLQTDFYNRAYIGATRVKNPSDEGSSGTLSNYTS